MKKILLSSICLGLISTSVLAGKEEKIRELIDLSFGSQTQLAKDLSQPVQIRSNEIMCRYVMNKDELKQVQTRLDNLLSTEDFTNVYVRFYSDHYTEEEIEELLKIYQSPVIQKSKELRPKLDETLMQSQKTFGKMIMPAVKNIDSELGVKYKKRPDAEYSQCLRTKVQGK